MEIFTEIIRLCDKYSNITVALGTFDGVHVGHQKIIGRAVELAKSIAGTSVVFTFSNHPLSIIDPARCPLQLITNEHKAELMQELGVDVLFNIPFTPDFLKLSPTDFITLLRANLQPKHIVVGPNYSFGYRGAGTPEFLRTAGEVSHFEVEVHPAVCINGNIVSSTVIRHLITEGNVAEASRLLGQPFKLKGIVISGDKRGRTLGFPTANLQIPEGFAVPNNGVYAVYVYIENRQYNGIVNIGTNPTFKGATRHIEAHVLNFAHDLYDKYIEIAFLNRIRGEKTFSSAEDLKSQICQDIHSAYKYY